MTPGHKNSLNQEIGIRLIKFCILRSIMLLVSGKMYLFSKISSNKSFISRSSVWKSLFKSRFSADSGSMSGILQSEGDLHFCLKLILKDPENGARGLEIRHKKKKTPNRPDKQLINTNKGKQEQKTQINTNKFTLTPIYSD